MITAAEHASWVAGSMKETVLQARVEGLCKWLGLRYYHTYRSTRSVAGFPDLVIVDAARERVIFAELKTQSGRVSTEQAAWLADLSATGRVEVYTWRPKDLLDGTIERILQPGDLR